MTIKLFAAFAALVLVASACEGATGDAMGEDHSVHSGGAEDGDVPQGEVPGAISDASEADREIVVKASDDLTFDPKTIDVKPGEVVTFVVQNEGSNVHEFVLGDTAYQAAHAEDTQDLAEHDMSGMENAVTVEPGETKEITWEFTEPTALQFACHEPGHYEGGMVGTIEVGE